jgi:magnesium chelatase family protein
METMSSVILRTRTQSGIKTLTVSVEKQLAGGLPNMAIVGLADTEVNDSRERACTTLINNQFENPACRITVKLSSVDLPKGGSRYDLAMALGMLPPPARSTSNGP